MFIVLFTIGCEYAKADSTADSLLRIAQGENDPIKVIEKLIWYSEEYCLSNTELSRGLAEKSLELSGKINYERGLAQSKSNIARTYLTQGDVENAMLLINDAIVSFEKNENLADLAHAHKLKSNMLGRLLQYENSINELKKAIEIYKILGDDDRVEGCLLNLAVEYMNIKNLDNALEILLKIEQTSKDTPSNKFYLPVNLGSVYYEKGEFDKALTYLKKALEDARFLKIPDAEVTSLHMLGQCHEKLGSEAKALQYYNDAVNLSRQNKLDDETILVLKDLTKFYENGGDFKSAYATYNDYIQLRDTVYSLDKINRISDLEKKLEIEKRESIIKLKNSEIEKGQIEIKVGRYRTIGISGGALLLLLICFVVFKNYKKTKKLNEEIFVQKLKVEEKNKDMLDSINYAKRIQSSILLPDAQLKNILQEHFILFKPKDIVSGDFYWVYNSPSNKVIFTVADCTGHGVPGALMSMVGNSLLNEIIIENEIEEPDEILNQLKAGLIKTLGQQDGGDTKDGMDMALCVWDRNSNQLGFSGANNPLYLIRNNEEELYTISQNEAGLKYCGAGLLEIKPDKQSIAFEEGRSAKFSQKAIQLKTNDLIYLFSDGFGDQFGGPRDKKFTSKKFKETLIKISKYPLKEQLHHLENEFQAWKANNEQVDDVCVMGIRI